MRLLNRMLLLALLLIVGLGLPGWAEEGAGWAPPKEGRPCYIIAHRGAHTEAPENTIPSLQKAIDLKLDFVEVDLRTSKDGHIFLLHNSTVDARTNGTGAAKDLLWADLQKLDAGSRFNPEFTGTRLPDFEEVLRVAQGKIGLYLDMKDAKTQPVIDLLAKYDMLDQVVVYADDNQQGEFARLAPGIKIMPEGYTSERTDTILPKFKPKVVAYVWKHFNEECVRKCHAAGAKVFVDTLGDGDNPEGMNKALDWGTDGLQTDYPEILLKVIKERMNR
ncbi:MAG: glycerophosphodiester phosphodiesterase family protein [bacterium]